MKYDMMFLYTVPAGSHQHVIIVVAQTNVGWVLFKVPLTTVTIVVHSVCVRGAIAH